MKLLALLLVLTFIFTGCTSARLSKSISSGAIGCPVSKITITNEIVSGGVHSFTASCAGKVYHCTYIYSSPTECKENQHD